MKKQLDEQTIANELSGASRFFEKSAPTNNPGGRKPNDRTVERSDNRPNSRSRKSSPEDANARQAIQSANRMEKRASDGDSVLSEIMRGETLERRPAERYSFEIYSDQKRRLKRLLYEYEAKTGKRLTASRLIREALEPYLQQLEVQFDEQ